MTNATDTSRYQYTGREFDGETGLYYYRARYYDSRNGRFVGQDPTGFNGGDSNLYRYVGNNPVTYVDSNGLSSTYSCGSSPTIPTKPSSASITNNIEIARDHSNFPLNLGWFRDQVQNQGSWDYKQLDPGTKNRSSPYEDFGNFNYGVTGRASGIPGPMLEREAGRAQIAAGTSRPGWGDPGQRGDLLGVTGSGTFGDDPSDNYWIRKGIEYYDDYYNKCYRRKGFIEQKINEIANPQSWKWRIF